MDEFIQAHLESLESSAVAKLDRKRATDRRAQRAARQRRQDYIDSLLNQIETLSGLTHSQVQDFFQSNERLRVENEQLRERAASNSQPRSDNGGSVRTGSLSSSPPGLLDAESQLSPPEVSIAYDHYQRRSSVQSSPHVQLELFQCLTNQLPPSCLPDQIIADFVHDVKLKGASATPCTNCPDIWLLCRPRPSELAVCPSVVVIDILSTFPDIVCLSEQVASFLFMYKLLKWECYPTLENYNAIPEWLRPTPTQLRIAHPAWMDRIPWPGMRSYLISQQANFDYDEFCGYYRTAMTVSWPYPAADILITCPSENCCKQTRINPVFEHHVMNLDVWGVKDSFLERFPMFKDVVGS